MSHPLELIASNFEYEIITYNLSAKEAQSRPRYCTRSTFDFDTGKEPNRGFRREYNQRRKLRRFAFSVS